MTIEWPLRLDHFAAAGKVTNENDYRDALVPILNSLAQKLGLQVGVQGASRIIHLDVATPVDATAQPGQGPLPDAFGSLIVLKYTLDTDASFRVIKVPKNFVGDASFHIHWTKSSDVNEQTKTVRWRLTYLVFDGASEDAAAAGTALVFDDTYDDAGTTTRVVHRTENIEVSDLVAGYYLAVKIEAITPAGTALASEPALVSADLLYRGTINEGDQ